MTSHSVAVIDSGGFNPDGSSRADEVQKCLPGEAVTLERDRSDVRYRNGVAVISARGVRIGSLGSEDVWIAPMLDKGRPISATVQGVQTGRDGQPQLMLMVETPKGVGGGGKAGKGCLIAIGIFLALGVVSVAFGPKNGQSGSSGAVASGASSAGEEEEFDHPDRAPMQVTAVELFRAYQSNEARAQRDYGDRRLRVTGVTEGVQLDFRDKPFVTLRTDNQFMSAQAHLTERAQADAANINRGDRIAVICESVSEVAGTPILKDCRFDN